MWFNEFFTLIRKNIFYRERYYWLKKFFTMISTFFVEEGNSWFNSFTVRDWTKIESHEDIFFCLGN